MAARNTLASLYEKSGNPAGEEKPVVSLEFFPPKKAENIPKTKELIRSLAQFDIAYMTVTYGAGGSTRGYTTELATFINQEINTRAICHLTCVNHSKDDLRNVLTQLQARGITDILALRGDAPPSETVFTPHPDGFGCARDLISFIRNEFDFSIAAAGYPECHREAVSPHADLKYLKEKVDAGAEVIITQLFFDPDIYFDFVDRCRGIDITVPIVPGIMPIRDYHQLKKFTSLCGASIPSSLLKELEAIKEDPAAVVDFGVQQALELSKKLIQGGAPGIHLYTLNQSDQVFKILTGINCPNV